MTILTLWKICLRPLSAMCFALALLAPSAALAQPAGGALDGERLRILISTDIGGSDGDDIQSFIHVLMYSDLFDIEGLVSSPPYGGRKDDFLPAIAAYEQDYPLMSTHGTFPTPNSLRALTKQGAIDVAPAAGYSGATEGSNWIIQQANKADSRPLYVLVWGSITDVAQALHDDPGIKSKIRVHFIASWNRLQDPNAFAYINNNHTDLWMIQDESSFRGWFTGGNQSGDLGNISFPQNHIFGKGALGVMFSQVQAAHAQVGEIKMGDSPTFARLLRGTPGDPGQPSWGGHFKRHSSRPNWWVDVTDTVYKEGNYFGAKTVNQWREGYLRDWQNRFLWLDAPSTPGARLAHYNFDVSSGTFVNQGTGGSSLNLTNTGGTSGRDNTGAGGYGAASLSGYGSAFNVLASGDGSYHTTTSSIGGGALTASAVPQSALQGSDGAFTYEALINVGTTAGEQNILSHDGATTRGFLFAVNSGQLIFYNGASTYQAAIPTTGTHAFSANAWYHVAVSYTGAVGSSGNLKFYWTALAASPTSANLIGTQTLSSDLGGSVSNVLGVGTTTRNPFRYEISGLVDEVRIHNIALTADAFAVFDDTPVLTPLQAWRFEHFGTTESEGDAADDEDPDKDGLDNLEEFYAGTIPDDALSVFRIRSGLRGEGYTLQIASVSGKTYQVLKTPTLLPPAWQPVGDSFPGTGEDIPFSDPDEGGFYRVGVSP